MALKMSRYCTLLASCFVLATEAKEVTQVGLCSRIFVLFAINGRVCILDLDSLHSNNGLVSSERYPEIGALVSSTVWAKSTHARDADTSWEENLKQWKVRKDESNE